MEETAQWRRDGYQNPADWLAARNGTSTGRARAELGTSKRLKELEETTDALRQGELSSEQAEAISDGVSVNPAAERELLDKAKRDSVKNLKDEAARKKAAADPDPEARHRRIHRERRLATFGRPDGSWGLAGNGTVDAGAIVNQALDRLIDERLTQARKLGLRESREAYAFDALVELARRALDPTHHWNTPAPTRGRGSGSQGTNGTNGRTNGTSGQSTGHPTGTGASGDHEETTPVQPEGPQPSGPHLTTRSKRVNPKHLALIRVDLEALIRGQVEGDELCEITGVGPIPVRVARGLLGDSILKLVITKGVDVANVTHLGRGVSVAPFERPSARQARVTEGGRAAERKKRAQRVKLTGAGPASNGDDDHSEGWAKTKTTRLDDTDRVCPHHHLKTYKDWALVEGTGRRPMVPPDHPRHPNNTGPPGEPEPSGARPTGHGGRSTGDSGRPAPLGRRG